MKSFLSFQNITQTQLSHLFIATMAWAIFSIFAYANGQAGTGQSQIILSGWVVQMDSICDIDFGNILQSSEVQVIIKEYPCDLSVTDNRWDNVGFNVSIAIDDMLAPWLAVGGQEKRITSSRLSISQLSGTATPLLWWDENTRIRKANLDHNTNDFGQWKTHTLLYRDPWENFWKVWRYATRPEMKLIIPPYTTPGIYTSSITVTLSENT